MPATGFVVDSGAIRSVSLHSPLPRLLQVAALPALLVELCVFVAAWPYLPPFFDEESVPSSSSAASEQEGIEREEEGHKREEDGGEGGGSSGSNWHWYLVLVGTLLTLHLLVYLASYWSVTWKAWTTCRKVQDVKDAKLVRVMVKEHHGSSALCPLQMSTVTNIKTGVAEKETSFVFQRRKFTYRETNGKKGFYKVEYPTDLTVRSYLECRGYANDATTSVEAAKAYYGNNEFDIPQRSFGELFQEQAVAPLFVFQVFCVLLWSLDGYWYFSLFTLFLLVVFESTVVFQRMRSMSELRKMAPKPYKLFVYRKQSWKEVESNELLPMDVCSLVRSSDADRLVPCDCILLHGVCIVNEAMLTGESAPAVKESISDLKPDEVADIFNQHKSRTIFGGTKIVQASATDDASSAIPKPPDGGAVCVVVRTGYGTSQGKLVRTILFSTERVTANNWESFAVILFLLLFALAAAYYVWIHGSVDPKRGRSHLLLDCILIIASVVPPELPMELSLAVNQSILALTKLAIFCTEPFRIPFAGKVDICCFDKTGTLTTEEIIVKGVAGLSDPPTNLTNADDLPELTMYVLATCHSLIQIENESIIGDPMEKAALSAIGWSFSKGMVAYNEKNKRVTLKLLRRFPFASSLKRMSAVSLMESTNSAIALPGSGLFVSVKGAPETIALMLTTVPAEYESTYKNLMKQGARVLALAYKFIDMRPKEVKDVGRETMESDLTFAGFLVVSCPLKPDAAVSLKSLANSSHMIMMITGDNPLTACHVAREVYMTSRPTAIIDVPEDVLSPKASDLRLTYIDSMDSDATPQKLDSIQAVNSVLKEKDICITGRALVILQQMDEFYNFLPLIRVFARTSPEQKEFILSTLRKLGFNTLMCGDGTNDVGALKQAHVGVALLDGKPEDLAKLTKPRIRRKPQKMNIPPNATRAQLAQIRQQQWKSMMEDVDDDRPIVKLGDASIAAPFTSKISHLSSVCDIVRQGRSTHITTVQMYKILSLNCLITAYSLSVLYLDGIKHADAQMTISGMLLSICFLGISYAKPVSVLSKQRPQTSVFNLYFLLSVLGQFAAHVMALMSISNLAKSEMGVDPNDHVDLEKEFEPNLLNSGVYLISLSMQVSTFVINYQGRPFRESITENKTLLYPLVAVMAVCVAAASDLFPDVHDMLSLVPFSAEFRSHLLVTLFLDFFVSFCIDRVASFLFLDVQPHRKLRPILNT